MSKSNVCFIKLVSGEELIGDIKFHQLNEERVATLKNPVALLSHPEKGLIMVPWIPYSDDKEFIMDAKNVMITATPAHQILNAYNEKYGSGLVIPTPTETMAVNSGPVLL